MYVSPVWCLSIHWMGRYRLSMLATMARNNGVWILKMDQCYHPVFIAKK